MRLPNVRRARAADKALAANSSDQARNSDQEAIIDLLANLRHLCDLRQLDFDALNRRAHSHYVDELKLTHPQIISKAGNTPRPYKKTPE